MTTGGRRISVLSVTLNYRNKFSMTHHAEERKKEDENAVKVYKMLIVFGGQVFPV
jgi:hypothetical protein